MWQSVLDWEKNMPDNCMNSDSELLTHSLTRCHLLLRQVIKQGLSLPSQTREGEACYCYRTVKKQNEITVTLIYQPSLPYLRIPAALQPR